MALGWLYQSYTFNMVLVLWLADCKVNAQGLESSIKAVQTGNQARQLCMGSFMGSFVCMHMSLASMQLHNAAWTSAQAEMASNRDVHK